MKGTGSSSIPPSLLSGPTGSIPFTLPVSSMSQPQNGLIVNKEQSHHVTDEAESLDVAVEFYLVT